jgi:hypothetical protein
MLASWLWEFVLATWDVFCEASIYILFGFLIAGGIHYWLPTRLVLRFLGGRKFTSVLLGSVAGLPLPLCSCSVVPTAIALRKQGASRGATASFLISTPETSVESIALTYGVMDLTMAIMRPVAALLTALFAGMATELFGSDEPEDPDAENVQLSPDSEAEQCKRCGSFTEAFWETFDDLSYYLLVGLVLSGLIAVLVPQDLVGRYLGGGIGSMLLVLVVSVPLYVCASGSTPVAAALILKGMSPGAALVFLLAGPATNVATLSLLWRFLGRRDLAIYLISIIAVALVMGVFVDSLYQSWQMDPQVSMGQPRQFIPQWMKQGGAVVLIGMLIYSIRRTQPPSEVRAVQRWLTALTAGWRIGPRFLLAALGVIVILAYLSTAVLMVQPGQVGLVKRFGKIIADDLPPGIHFHWPVPFATGQTCDMEAIRSLRIGFTQQPVAGGQAVESPLAGSPVPWRESRTVLGEPSRLPEEAYFLTGDENEMDIQAVVHYRVSDPLVFLFDQEKPDQIIRNHALAVLIEQIGSNRIDDVYTHARGDIESSSLRALRDKAARAKLGVDIVAFLLLKVHAPPEVHDAFRDLSSAREDRSRMRHEGRAVAAGKVYSASGQAEQLLAQARADQAESILQSRGQSEAWQAISREYSLGPLAAETRLWYEMLEKLLPEKKLYILPPGAEDRLSIWSSTMQRPGLPASPPDTGQRSGAKPPTLEELLRP